MSKVTLIINGVNFTPFLSKEGIEIKRNDVDGPEAGEMADGTVRRDRKIIRPTIEVRLMNMTLNVETGVMLLNALNPQWLDVTYYDLRKNALVTAQFYTNNIVYTTVSEENGEAGFKISPFTLTARGIPGDGRATLG